MRKIIKNIKISVEELLKAIDKWLEQDQPEAINPRTTIL